MKQCPHFSALAFALFLSACDGKTSADGADPTPESGPLADKVEKVRETAQKVGDSLSEARDRASEAATDKILPPEQEERLGDRLAGELERELVLRVIGDGPDKVRRIGTMLLKAATDSPAEIKYDFHVVEDPEINAFAIPGGHIYVTTGLLDAAGSEDELAAVLAHEIAHVTNRHAARRIAAQYGVSVVTRIALGGESTMMGEIVASLLGQGVLLKHSRDNEREADQSGLRYVIESGYSPQGYITFFERIAAQPRPPAILSTHPNPEERIENARAMLKDLSPEPAPPKGTR